jgi:8-oxo-dGTP diphosphatase
MWADDQHWLHRMLVGDESFMGRFVFDGDAMHWHEIVWHEGAPPANANSFGSYAFYGK